MEYVPASGNVLENVALPVLSILPDPSDSMPSMNSTVPVGLAGVEEAGADGAGPGSNDTGAAEGVGCVTVAVNTTEVPTVAGFRLDVRAVAVTTVPTLAVLGARAVAMASF
jgi:hypothetical protein